MHALGIVVAMPLEARALRRHPPLNRITAAGEGVSLFVCGIGAANARRAAGRLLGAGVSALVSWGTAGGLAAGLEPGTVLLPETILDGKRAFSTDGAWRSRLGGALQEHFVLSSAAVYSGDQLVDTVTAKEHVAQDTGAAAVDMESSAIAAAAADARASFMCIRVVADPVSAAVPAALVGAIDGEGFISTARLLRNLAGRPADLPAILRLGRQFRRAAAVLRQVAVTCGPRLLAP